MTGITNPTEEYFKDGLWGWDGSQWRKLGILFGYHSTLAQNILNSSAAAGTNVLETAAVSSGEIWVVEAIGVMDVHHAPSGIIFCVRRGGEDYPFHDTTTTAASTWLCWTGRITLGPGDIVKIYILGCTAGDELKLRVLGYKVSLA